MGYQVSTDNLILADDSHEILIPVQKRKHWPSTAHFGQIWPIQARKCFLFFCHNRWFCAKMWPSVTFQIGTQKLLFIQCKILHTLLSRTGVSHWGANQVGGGWGLDGGQSQGHGQQQQAWKVECVLPLSWLPCFCLIVHVSSFIILWTLHSSCLIVPGSHLAGIAEQIGYKEQ